MHRRFSGCAASATENQTDPMSNLYCRQDVVAFAVNVSHIRNSPEESEEGGVRGDQSFAFVRSAKGDRFDALS